MNAEEILQQLRGLELFGSYARGEQDQDSDVDVLVEFEETPGLFEFVRLELALTELLEVKVDLVMKDALRPRIARQIRHEAVVV